MIDFGILAAFKNILMDDDNFKKTGLDQSIFTNIPKSPNYPCILLELEEIWSTVKHGTETGFIKLKIKASTYSQTIQSRESLGIADQIRNRIDGKNLQTFDGKKGMVRLANSVIDMPSATKPLSVKQYFDVLVRG